MDKINTIFLTNVLVPETISAVLEKLSKVIFFFLFQS